MSLLLILSALTRPRCWRTGHHAPSHCFPTPMLTLRVAASALFCLPCPLPPLFLSLPLPSPPLNTLFTTTASHSLHTLVILDAHQHHTLFSYQRLFSSLWSPLTHSVPSPSLFTDSPQSPPRWHKKWWTLHRQTQKSKLPSTTLLATLPKYPPILSSLCQPRVRSGTLTTRSRSAGQAQSQSTLRFSEQCF